QFLDDPHVQARGIVVDAPDDEMGEVPMHAPVPTLSRTPGTLRMPAPAIGQHNDEIYGRIGYDAARRADLRARGLI
ncbi:MAG TPA: CoA transferase, partial [Terriglobales bacterium]|nr:CoA transferase [Terriglobales bacterium]